MINYIVLTALQLLALINTVSDWRIHYFREFPYLYAHEGNLDYEKEYTKAYLLSPKSSLAAAYEDRKLVGILSGIPLSDDVDFIDSQESFEKIGLNAKEFYYFGEVIILPDFRKKGIAKHLFALSEKKALELGYNKFCFVTIEHPEDHPLKPVDYEDPSEVWQHLGYQKTAIKLNVTYPTISYDGSIYNANNILVFWTKTIKY